MTNAEIAMAFDQIADLLEFQGANPFRVRAYRNGTRAINDLHESLESVAADPERKFTEISGIGKDLSDKILVLLQTGRLPMLEELQAQVPREVLELLRIPGLGPKKAAVLHKELGIKSLAELKQACMEQRVRVLKGFGTKTEETLLKGCEMVGLAPEKRILWAEADEFAQAILNHLRQTPWVQQIEAAGSYRRGRETIGDVDILVTSTEVEKVMDAFAAFYGNAASVLARGGTKMSLRLNSGLQIDLRVVPEESFGAALQYFTGSKDHNVVMRGMAKDRGLKINEYGVFRGDEYIAGRTEAEVYATLELPCFPPEMREARREFDWAAAGSLPTLLELDDLLGDLHMHTTETDGKATLEEMVAAAKARGLKYIAITDHSKRISMANGLDGPRLFQQWAEIDRLNAKQEGFTILKGVEVDILEKGGLDLADDVLKEADWVVASLHYGQNQPREQITRRMLDALQNPYVSTIGHPTGRLLNKRKPYEIDLDTLYKGARDYGKFLELNANPHRLDLDDQCCAAAKSHGIPIVISTDAHSTEGLAVMRYGILQARRAGLTKDDVANTRTWPQLKKMLGRG